VSSFLLASGQSDRGVAALRTSTRALVAARSAIRQAGLEKMLAESSEFETVGVCASLTALEERARQVRPDLIVLDYDGESPADALTAELGRIPASISTVVLVDDPVPAFTAALLAAGAAAVIQRDSSFDELASTLHAVAEGLTVLGTEFARSLAERLPHREDAEAMEPAEKLTEREMDVLELLARGIGNKEIGAQLGISEHTVKFHISSILGKLSAANRTEAVTHGIRRGLIIV
jgi:two-component system, NarL family, response regulator YdfI